MRDIKSIKSIKISELEVNWLWFLALGIILLVFGIIALSNLLLATVIGIVFIGTIMVFSGLSQIVHAFAVKEWGNFLLLLVSGVLYTAAGILVFFNPYITVPILILILAFSLIIIGLLRIMVGFYSHMVRGAMWVVVSGVLTSLLGVLILVGWPMNSWSLVGIFLAVDLIFQGLGWVVFSLSLRSFQRQ